MRTREWERIIKRATPEAMLAWLKGLPAGTTFLRGNGCCCPLHDFIEAQSGRSLLVGSQETSEHWAKRDSQTWPTPWWMTWFIRAIEWPVKEMLAKEGAGTRHLPVISVHGTIYTLELGLAVHFDSCQLPKHVIT